LLKSQKARFEGTQSVVLAWNTGPAEQQRRRAMTEYSWSETANGLARQVRQAYAFVERGAVPLRFVDDSSGAPHFVDDAPLVIGVFGNDNYLWDDNTRKEVELVRHGLLALDAAEMGFGLSDDGQTWTILVGTDRDRYQTKAGQLFQKELLKASLERIVWNAHRQVNGLPADTALEESACHEPAQGGTVIDPH
jgi:hypothetical protein